MDALKIIRTLKELISRAQLNEACEVLLNFGKGNKDVSKELESEILLIVSKYQSLTAKSSRNAITNSEFNLETKRIVHSILLLIEDIERGILKQHRLSYGSENIVKESIKNNNKIKIAVLSANPRNKNPLRLEKEIREIRLALQYSNYKEMFQLEVLTAVRIKDLQDCLLDYRPNFVHFAGHGNEDGIALLDSQTDEAQLVQSEPLSNLFKLFSNDIACVFLNSCYSKKQGEQIRKFIPHVIGMNREIPDPTAIEFASTFYRGIASGNEIELSFAVAKNSIELHNLSGKDIPISL